IGWGSSTTRTTSCGSRSGGPTTAGRRGCRIARWRTRASGSSSPRWTASIAARRDTTTRSESGRSSPSWPPGVSPSVTRSWAKAGASWRGARPGTSSRTRRAGPAAPRPRSWRSWKRFAGPEPLFLPEPVPRDRPEDLPPGLERPRDRAGDLGHPDPAPVGDGHLGDPEAPPDGLDLHLAGPPEVFVPHSEPGERLPADRPEG